MITNNCLECGKTYSSYHKDTKYCSRKCFGKHNYFKKGNPRPKNAHCYKCGDKHIRWKGGRIVESAGYIMIFKPEHPFCIHTGYVFEHRLVIEKNIGRYLLKCERVHHVNGDKTDNRIENLMLFKGTGEHLKYHKIEREKNAYIQA